MRGSGVAGASALVLTAVIFTPLGTTDQGKPEQTCVCSIQAQVTYVQLVPNMYLITISKTVVAEILAFLASLTSVMSLQAAKKL